MDLTIQKQIRDNGKLRESFNRLADESFGISFEAWYQGGYWTDKFVPWVIAKGDKVIANASVNLMDTVWNGQPKRYIQIGTVMTDKAYRGRGLSRCLIEGMIEYWRDNCDGIYLYANDSVLDFYPKFGFAREMEYRYSISITHREGTARKLDMMRQNDRELLKQYYAKSNPFSALPILNNYELLMFYCLDYRKDCVFYSSEFDAVVIGRQDNDIFTCFDVFCDEGKSLIDILAATAAAAGGAAGRAVLGFTPKDRAGDEVNAINDDGNTLFVLKDKDNIFAEHKVRMPELSHA